MTITLTNEESLKYFYNALCNVGNSLRMSGLELDYKEHEYAKSRSKLVDPCFEDVILQMVKDGYTLTLEDVEGEGENTKSITIQDIFDRVQNMPIRHLSDLVTENDDAITADVLLQQVFFNEIIFG